MKNAQRSTPSGEAYAAIYRDAARRLVESDYGNFYNGTHCPDIAIGTTDKNYQRDPQRMAFRNVFDTQLGSFRRHREAATLALCFMAAMVETGDA